MYANGGPGPLCRKGERRIAYRPKTDIFLGSSLCSKSPSGSSDSDSTSTESTISFTCSVPDECRSIADLGAKTMTSSARSAKRKMASADVTYIGEIEPEEKEMIPDSTTGTGIIRRPENKRIRISSFNGIMTDTEDETMEQLEFMMGAIQSKNSRNEGLLLDGIESSGGKSGSIDSDLLKNMIVLEQNSDELREMIEELWDCSKTEKKFDLIA